MSAVAAQLDELENRVERRMQVHFERMEDLVERAAEGYGGTLESIDRRLDRLQSKWDTKIGDHDSILSKTLCVPTDAQGLRGALLTLAKDY